MTDVCCSIAFSVAGEAIAKGNLRSSRSGHSYYPNGAKVRPWAARIADAAAESMGRGGLWTAPVSLSVIFAVARPKGHLGTGRNAGVVKASAPTHPTTLPDLDKLLRTVLDAMTGVVYRDDAQVVSLTATKEYAAPDEMVGVYVSASEYKEPDR